MKELCWVTCLVAIGCQSETSRNPETNAAARPAPAQETVPNDRSRDAVPFSPRTDAAQFFSRPAPDWTEQGLELVNFEVSVDVASGLATSTLDVSVKNPSDKQSEAVIDLPMPPGAAIIAATLYVGEKPMQGVMLEQRKAQRVYDEIVGRRRDPLLVTWKAADMVGLAIFPLEAKQTRRFILTWVEPVLADKHWIPSIHHRGKLVGAPSKLRVLGKEVSATDSWVEIPETAPSAGGSWRLAHQQPLAPKKIVLVVNTSGEHPLKRSPQWAEIEEAIASFKGGVPITLLAADWTVTDLGTVTTTEELAEVQKRFLKIRSAGLFDQHAALEHAAKLAGPTGAVIAMSQQARYRSSGPKSYGAPIYWLGNTPSSAGDPVETSGGQVTKRAGELGKIVHAHTPPRDSGFDWLPLQAATGHTVWIGAKEGTKASDQTPATSLEAVFYKAMLRRARIPENKIVSPYTSILVLESEEAFKKWGIKDKDGVIARKPGTESDLGGLLGAGVGPGGGGTGWSTVRLGNYGTIGHGGGTGSGYGAGSGGLRGRRYALPRIRIGNVTVKGDLDKNIIRRYIRRSLPRLRHCYEQALLRNDELEGKLVVEFRIENTGFLTNVKATMAAKNTKTLLECIEKHIKRIQMPKPKGGGFVEVRYPFTLKPGSQTVWAKTRKLLLKRAPGFEKKIAALFEYKGPLELTPMAWWLAETKLRNYGSPPMAYETVAMLLRDSSEGGALDARRILSEGAARRGESIAIIFEAWGLKDDAQRARQVPRGRTF